MQIKTNSVDQLTIVIERRSVLEIQALFNLFLNSIKHQEWHLLCLKVSFLYLKRNESRVNNSGQASNTTVTQNIELRMLLF